MRVLRLVGPGEDGDHVVVATIDGDEQFRLTLDDALRAAAARRAPRRLVGVFDGGGTTIRPREIQVRVRAGEAPEALAAEHDIPIERVMLFAQQVLEERGRVAGEARRSRARRGSPDGQLVQFGATVDARFAAHGVDPAAVRWDARRSADGHWVVSATWRGGESDRTADWAFSLAARTVTPIDETAADLLSDRPLRPVVRAVPDVAAAPADALTAPLPVAVDDQFFDQDAPAGAAEEPAALPLRLADPMPAQPSEPAEPSQRSEAKPDGPARPDGPSRRRRQRSSPTPTGPQAPTAAAAPPAASAAHPEPAERSKNGRPQVPGWDDILLGVRRKRD